MQKQLNESSEALRQGIRPKRDHVRIQTEVQRNELALVSLRNQVEKNLNTLKLLIGYREQDQDSPSFEPLPVSSKVLNESEGERLAIEKTSVFQRSLLEDRQSDLSLDLERRRNLWPALDFSANTGYRAQNFVGPESQAVQDSDSVYWSVGLGLKYTIWDWGTQSRNVSAALAQRTLDRTKRAEELDGLKSKLETAERELEQAARSHKLSQDLLKLDEESYVNVEQDYRQGRASYLEVFDATEKLQQSRVGVAQSYFQWLRNSWNLKFFRGTIYEASQVP